MLGKRIRRLIAALASVTLGAALGAGLTAGPAQAAAPQAAAAAGVKVLMDSYDSGNGLIGDGWWTSAVALSTVMTYQQTTNDTSYSYAISGAFNANKGSNFENSYLDDTGWWALAWVQAYDITGDADYLHMAETDAAYIHGYWDSTCGGGVWWSTAKTYKNAIPNELFLELTAALHNRVAGDTTYLGWANAEWNWFNGSGMINGSHLINDGLSGTCQNNGQTVWTYNQGVVLAGLSELAHATGNSGLLSTAESLANASTAYFSHNGVVVEPCEPNCGADGPSFKGIYVRGLRTLANVAGTTAYDGFLQAQANSIVAHDTNSSGQFGLSWAGPVQSLSTGTQSSAEAALVVNARNRYEVAFSAGTGNQLYLYGNGGGAINGGTGVSVAPGTSPAIAELAGGGIEVAVNAAGTNQLYLYGAGAGSVNGATSVGVAPGTSPAITALPGGGFQTVFSAAGSNTLWRYGVGAGSYTGSTPVGLAAGTSPAITTLANGSVQVAFNAGGTNQLYLYGNGPGVTDGGTSVGVASGTSPAITALPGGGFQTVFSAAGSNTLWRYGVGAGSYTGSTPVGLAAGTSPAITTLANGSIQVAFNAGGTNQLYLYGNGPGVTDGGTSVGVASGTSPAITALPGGGFQTVFSAAGSNTLWRYGVGAGSYTGSTPVGLAAGTSPATN
ncbi:putative alpha-1,6-mannanase (GH76 family) [Catenulispora sp. GAS73]|uniref:glycoside hydrolase family 76 protein n=1 Tax=Catenulispora sp. GAS73 TaxID=3156269 RepID=UPI00351786C3